MRVLGIDPGLASCGFALLAGGSVLEAGCVKTKRSKQTGDLQARVSSVLSALRPLVLAADVIVIEWPSVGTGAGRARWGSKSAGQTLAVAAALLGQSSSAADRVFTPAPVTWRAAHGAKRGKDSGIHAALSERFAPTVATMAKGAVPHVLDAIGLALYGETVANQNERPIKKNRGKR